MKVRKSTFYINMIAKDCKEIRTKDNRKDALLEVGRLLALTKESCKITIHRSRRHGKHN